MSNHALHFRYIIALFAVMLIFGQLGKLNERARFNKFVKPFVEEARTARTKYEDIRKYRKVLLDNERFYLQKWHDTALLADSLKALLNQERANIYFRREFSIIPPAHPTLPGHGAIDTFLFRGHWIITRPLGDQ